MQGTKKALVCGLLALLALQAIFVVSVASEEAAADPAGAGDATEVVQEEENKVVDGLTADERKLVEENAEKFEFQAEVGRLMDIIINSLYSKKEIFLRELISNASDACDKIRFVSLTDREALGDNSDLDIRIEADKDARTLSITDKGVGMTRNDLINNLGTIAKSGTSQFVEAVQKSGDMNLIGQFGVGFYSVYLVADKVTVTTKANNDKQLIWESAADANFSISEDPRGNTLGRGTRVTMHLKKDASEYLDEPRLRELILRYSEFINFPIYLNTEKTVEEEVPSDEEEEKKEDSTEENAEEAKDGEDDAEVKEVEEGEEEKPKTKKVKKTVREWEQVNKNKAIWLREASDISDEEYGNFYKSLSKDYQDPAARMHFSAEGQIDFKSILFIPKSAPSSMFDNMNKKMENIKLYVRRVFISDEFEDLVPRYLSFITGVVDSEDLPLNVSREMLQQSRILKVIKKKLVSKALEMIRKLSDNEEKALDKGEEGDEKKDDESEDKKEDDEEGEEEEGEEEEEDAKTSIQKYKDFIKEFGKAIKLGVVEDTKNRKKLVKFLRYESTSTKDGESVSLQRYVDRMPEDQKHVYYIAGDNKADLKASPYLEKLAKRGFEVLLMTDPMDEYVMQHLDEFEDRTFVNVAKEDIKFGDKTEKREKRLVERAKEDMKEFLEWFKETLGSDCEKVVVSNRLTVSPVAIVSGTYGYTAHMERLMKAQALSDPSKYSFMAPKKTLEINAFHPMVKELARRVGEDKESEDNQKVARLLFESAMVQGDFELSDKSRFTHAVQDLIRDRLSVAADAQVETPELPEAEEEAPAKDGEKEEEEDEEKDEL